MDAPTAVPDRLEWDRLKLRAKTAVQIAVGVGGILAAVAVYLRPVVDPTVGVVGVGVYEVLFSLIGVVALGYGYRNLEASEIPLP